MKWMGGRGKGEGLRAFPAAFVYHDMTGFSKRAAYLLYTLHGGHGVIYQGDVYGKELIILFPLLLGSVFVFVFLAHAFMYNSF